MNMHGMPQPGMGGNMLPVGVSPGMMQQSSPQQPPQMQGMQPQQIMPPQQQQQQQQQPMPNPQQQQQQQQQQVDNITKIKTSLGPLRETLSATFKSAALSLNQNNLVDTLKKDTTTTSVKFEKHLEDFYSICDQIELHLITAAQTVQQQASSQKYLPGNVAAGRMEPYMQTEQQGNPMPYPQYLNTVRGHVSSAKDLHDTLISAAQNISQSD